MLCSSWRWHQRPGDPGTTPAPFRAPLPRSSSQVAWTRGTAVAFGVAFGAFPGVLCSSSSSTPKRLIANVLQTEGCQHKPWLLSCCQPAQLPPVTLCRSYCNFRGRPGQKKVASCGFAPLQPSSPQRCCSHWSPQPHQETHEGNYQPGEREKHPHLCGERTQ